MPTYEVIKSGQPHELLDRVMREQRQDLEDAEVTIGLLWAQHGENDDPLAPCLKAHGYTAAAIVRINPVRARVEGLPDATIAICKRTWDRLPEPSRLALIDHEVYHLELDRDRDGHVKSDDHGRPKLKMRLHDYQVGAFRAIIERHGEHSLDLQQIRRLADMDIQLLLPMTEEVEAA